MKRVYIFFIATQFKTGKTIRFLTGNKYNHVAFSFDKTGQTLYSYSRYRYNEPLLSGFGIEYTDRYATTQDGTKIKVCEYEVSDAHYHRIQGKIKRYCALKNKAQYNFFDILGYPFHVHVKLKYTHTCISFLLDLLERHDIHTIGQLERRLKKSVIYKGKLDDYIKEMSSGEIDFFERRPPAEVYTDTAKYLGCLALRFILGCFTGVA